MLFLILQYSNKSFVTVFVMLVVFCITERRPLPDGANTGLGARSAFPADQNASAADGRASIRAELTSHDSVIALRRNHLPLAPSPSRPSIRRDSVVQGNRVESSRAEQTQRRRAADTRCPGPRGGDDAGSTAAHEPAAGSHAGLRPLRGLPRLHEDARECGSTLRGWRWYGSASGRSTSRGSCARTTWSAGGRSDGCGRPIRPTHIPSRRTCSIASWT
jgi:hypothetical protein